jgi:hypothetical protein
VAATDIMVLLLGLSYRYIDSIIYLCWRQGEYIYILNNEELNIWGLQYAEYNSIIIRLFVSVYCYFYLISY